MEIKLKKTGEDDLYIYLDGGLKVPKRNNLKGNRYWIKSQDYIEQMGLTGEITLVELLIGEPKKTVKKRFSIKNLFTKK